MLVHRTFDDGVNIGERASIMKEGVDGNLVCGVEHAGQADLLGIYGTIMIGLQKHGGNILPV